jgi:hypothetical protein
MIYIIFLSMWVNAIVCRYSIFCQINIAGNGNNGDTTHSIMTFSIMTLSMKGLFSTLGINDIQHSISSTIIVLLDN